MNKSKIKCLIEEGIQEFEKVRMDPETYSLAVAFTLKDILEDIKKEFVDSTDYNVYLKALRDIDTHIRSTKEPTSYIIKTLKDILPEYKEDRGNTKTTNREFKRGIYKHFKGNKYVAIDIAEHTETGNKYVVYKAMYGECKVYIRPLEMFLSKVDKVKHPDVKQEYRFELIREF